MGSIQAVVAAKAHDDDGIAEDRRLLSALAMAMPPSAGSSDLAIVGGGLAGGLIALALARRRPDLRVTLIEESDRIGGNHIWSFFASDVAAADQSLVEPLICHQWPAYDVRFPGYERTIACAYQSIESERLEAAVRAALPAEAILTGRKVAALGPRTLVFADGTRLSAGGVIDARGAGDLSALDLGWQKFVGQELVLAAPHGLTRPIVMDATVDQADGYRFVYVLPFAADRLFVEDTYYSEDATLDEVAIGRRIAGYAASAGWEVASVSRCETGVLPVAMGGDITRHLGHGVVAVAGVRAGLFHPTTGYSLPDAVRTAALVAAQEDLSGEALAWLLTNRARASWRARGFYRLLDRMLFRAAEPMQRYRVLARFYRLDAALIGRFYAARSTLADKARILAGRPPVPIARALGQLREKRR